MKVMVLFDLPTTAANQRRAYEKFRKQILKLGFVAFQKSVYVKDCDNEWHMKMLSGMVEKILPAEGNVATCSFSDRQWANVSRYENGQRAEEKHELHQMVLML